MRRITALLFLLVLAGCEAAAPTHPPAAPARTLSESDSSAVPALPPDAGTSTTEGGLGMGSGT